MSCQRNLCRKSVMRFRIQHQHYDIVNFSKDTKTWVKTIKNEIGLENGKIAHPCGIAENVPLGIKNLFLLMDFFFILDMKEYCFTLILLGRPFVGIVRAVIDVNKKETVIHSWKEYEILRFWSMSCGKMKHNNRTSGIGKSNLKGEDQIRKREDKEHEGQGLPRTT